MHIDFVKEAKELAQKYLKDFQEISLKYGYLEGVALKDLSPEDAEATRGIISNRAVTTLLNEICGEPDSDLLDLLKVIKHLAFISDTMLFRSYPQIELKKRKSNAKAIHKKLIEQLKERFQSAELNQFS